MVTGEQELMSRSSKVSGFLLRAKPDLTVHYRVTSRSSHYQAGCGRPALEQIEGRDFRKPIRLTAGSGPRSQTASNDLEEGDSASTTLDTAFPPSGISTKFSAQAVTKNSNFTPETFHAINCYRGVRV